MKRALIVVALVLSFAAVSEAQESVWRGSLSVIPETDTIQVGGGYERPVFGPLNLDTSLRYAWLDGNSATAVSLGGRVRMFEGGVMSHFVRNGRSTVGYFGVRLPAPGRVQASVRGLTRGFRSRPVIEAIVGVPLW